MDDCQAHAYTMENTVGGESFPGQTELCEREKKEMNEREIATDNP